MKDSEYVSAEQLVQQEIMRGTASGAAASRAQASGFPTSDETVLAIIRRWYWTRKTNRGFILAGFPATVAQALVFDQWLEERDETLTACLWCGDGQALNGNRVQPSASVAHHYRDRGLLVSINDLRESDEVNAVIAQMETMVTGR